jgi:hypothetical protein
VAKASTIVAGPLIPGHGGLPRGLRIPLILISPIRRSSRDGSPALRGSHGFGSP